MIPSTSLSINAPLIMMLDKLLFLIPVIWDIQVNVWRELTIEQCTSHRVLPFLL